MKWAANGTKTVKFLKRKNTFLDFIAVSEGLIDQGYTSSDKLSIIGGSAGGLLIGASLNMRPDLYNAAVADVPFVDVVTTMLDESIPLTAGEWEEWGNPANKEYFDYMLSYSPYDNVTAQDYPHLLVTSGLNDPRVQYWEPTKWVAKLRVRQNRRPATPASAPIWGPDTAVTPAATATSKTSPSNTLSCSTSGTLLRCPQNLNRARYRIVEPIACPACAEPNA